MDKQSLFDKFKNAHKIPQNESDFAVTYDTREVFENATHNRPDEFNRLVLSHVGTTGSSICAGAYAGHGFGLDYRFKWVIREYTDWNKNVTQILIPLKK